MISYTFTWRGFALHLSALLLVLWLAACAASDTDPASDGDEPDGDLSPIPVNCEAPLPLAPTRLALDENHPCFQWLDRIIGRAVVQTRGSAAIWSRDTPSGVALLVTAMHTLGAGWFGPLGEEVAGGLLNPSGTMGVTRLYLLDPQSLALRDSRAMSAFFALFHAGIPAAVHTRGLWNILPRHDLVVGLVDDRLYDQSLMGATGLLNLAPPDLYDPYGDTTATPGWGEAEAGDSLMIVGKPGEARELHLSLGLVLSDSEAEDAIAHLALLGDEEGEIAYDSEAEWLLVAEVLPGMSGSGLFDREGRLCGILVRGSEADPQRQIARAVRMSYLVRRMREAVESLDEPEKAEFLPFLTRELAP